MKDMKDSGVEWIGKIPVGWGVTKIKSISTSVDNGVWGEDPVPGKETYKVLRSTEQTIDGQWNITAPAERDLSSVSSLSKYVVQKDDLLITKSSGSDEHIGKTTLVTSEIAAQGYFYSNFLGRIRVSERYSSKLLWYLLNSNVARSQFVYLQNSTSGLGNINSDMINNLWLPMMSINEQHRIASFLDTKCAEIDSISKDIRKEIETLQEYRKSVITEAVTKGLNDSVEQKETSIEGVNSIPFHWEESKLNYESYIRARLGWKGLKAEEYVDEGYAFISAFNIQNSKLVWEPINFITKERYDESPEIKIHIGDVLLVKDGAGVGKCARVDELTMGETAPNSSIGMITPYRRLEYRYLYYYLLTSTFNDFVLKLYNGMGVPHLTQEVLKTLRIPLPPFSEQCSISNYLDSKCAEIDSIIEDKQKQLDTLAEYRKSLIYDYVTGKKEVPEC